MSILYKRRVLAAKQESTPGTAESLTNTEAIFVFDPSIQADIPPATRNATGSLSQLVAVPGPRKSTMKFSVELAGSGSAGTDPTWASVLLAGCGMTSASHVYTFTSDPSNYKTLTL